MRVSIANNGKEGVEMVESRFWDLVLMDIQMPVMDGYEASRAIRELPGYQDLPIVAMTANAMSGDRELCLAAGMNDHVAKPIDPSNLYATLKKWIKIRDGLGTAPLSSIDGKSGEVNFPESIQGIDLEAGLSRVAGNEKLYLRLLRKFGSSQGAAVTEIQTILDSDGVGAAVERAHTLKGVAGNIGAMELHRIVASLELALTDGQSDVADLLNAAQVSLNELKVGLESVPEEELVETSAAKLDREQLAHSLNRLFKLLLNDNTEAEKLAEQLLPQVEADMRLDLEGIVSTLGSYDFESAITQLQSLAEEHDVQLSSQ